MLDCVLIWFISSVAGELRIGAELVSAVVALSWPDVVGETRPVVGVLALDMGLDGCLFRLHITAREDLDWSWVSRCSLLCCMALISSPDSTLSTEL